MAKEYRQHTRDTRQENNRNNDLMLTAPYNFVPLASQVVRPEWASQISHEMPFPDAQCGTLQLTIKAEQPIFTRNNVSRRETDEDKRKVLGSHFSKTHDDRYFLPGSSIKGAIRNVLEIISFGDLAKGLEDVHYGMRDLYHDDYKARFAINAKHKVHGGWLYEQNGSYLLNDCGEPAKVPQTWIDEHFHTLHFPVFAEGKMQMNDDYKAAKKKYVLFAGKSLKVNFGDTEGTLVFTGQPSANTKPKAKTNEFLFPTSNNIVEVGDVVIKNFRLAYYDSDRNSQKPDYKFWSEKLKKGEPIPVFFHKNDKGEVVSFGLAYMYKIPFTYSVKEAILNHQEYPGAGPDLAECIFGHVEKNNALHGRVIFGHAFANGNPKEESPKYEVLNSPKATYYPTYIRQEIGINRKVTGGKYKTLFDKAAVPSGWKRYPVHSDGLKENPGPLINGKRNEKIQTKFCPLPTGTQFTCTVNYHNLNKVELGALLSALTFHNTADCFHTLGMAKPLGYGKCTIEVSGMNEKLRKECLCAYEHYMEINIVGGWLKSDQVRELISMSTNQKNTGRSLLKYMPDVKDFAKAKNQKLALDCYTKLEGISTNAPGKLWQTELPENPEATRKATSSQAIFEQHRQKLIDGLKEERRQQANKEQKEREAEEQQRIATEKERLQEAAKAAELTAGINLNGVTERKTIDGLMRTLRRWTETLGGNIGIQEIEQVKARTNQIYSNLRTKEKHSWLENLKSDIMRLDTYLSQEQIKEVQTHIKTLT